MIPGGDTKLGEEVPGALLSHLQISPAQECCEFSGVLLLAVLLHMLPWVDIHLFPADCSHPAPFQWWAAPSSSSTPRPTSSSSTGPPSPGAVSAVLWWAMVASSTAPARARPSTATTWSSGEPEPQAGWGRGCWEMSALETSSLLFLQAQRCRDQRLRGGCWHQGLLLRLHGEHHEELPCLLRGVRFHPHPPGQGETLRACWGVESNCPFSLGLLLRPSPHLGGLQSSPASVGSVLEPPSKCPVSLLQDLRYIFIPSDLRDYVMLRSAIQGSPVPEGSDKGDE